MPGPLQERLLAHRRSRPVGTARGHVAQIASAFRPPPQHLHARRRQRLHQPRRRQHFDWFSTQHFRIPEPDSVPRGGDPVSGNLTVSSPRHAPQTRGPRASARCALDIECAEKPRSAISPMLDHTDQLLPCGVLAWHDVGEQHDDVASEEGTGERWACTTGKAGEGSTRRTARGSLGISPPSQCGDRHPQALATPRPRRYFRRSVHARP